MATPSEFLSTMQKNFQKQIPIYVYFHNASKVPVINNDNCTPCAWGILSYAHVDDCTENHVLQFTVVSVLCSRRYSISNTTMIKTG